jgi:hypothetical protein
MLSIVIALVLAVDTGAAIVHTDTSAVLRAVAAHMRVEKASDDSARAERCRAGDRATCPPMYRHPAFWYLEPDSSVASRNAQAIALIDSIPAHADARMPSCPWPASAPMGSGYRARVTVEFESDSVAFVQVQLRCSNPRGYMHPQFTSDRSYRVVRTASGWKAYLESSRIT